MADVKVSWSDDIPKISREGRSRKSKYDDLIEACVGNPGKAAKIQVDSQGMASSRASSIKTAASKHENVASGDGHFKVVTRSGEGEDEFYVYVQYNEGAEPEDEEDEKPKKKVAKKRAKKA